jgi:pantothenate kinase-related protein Tda10
MKNLSKKKLSEMSDNTLSERLDALASVINRLTNDYGHVFDSDERLCVMVQEEIDMICEEQDRREDDLILEYLKGKEEGRVES